MLKIKDNRTDRLDFPIELILEEFCELSEKLLTMLFMITCQSFFMVNALIERPTAGSDY